MLGIWYNKQQSIAHNVIAHFKNITRTHKNIVLSLNFKQQFWWYFRMSVTDHEGGDAALDAVSICVRFLVWQLWNQLSQEHQQHVIEELFVESLILEHFKHFDCSSLGIVFSYKVLHCIWKKGIIENYKCLNNLKIYAKFQPYIYNIIHVLKVTRAQFGH